MTVKALGKNVMRMNQLEQVEFIFHKIMDISADGFLIVDKDANIIAMNKAYCHYIGCECSEVVGKFVTEVIKNSQLPELLKTGKTEVDVVHNLIQGQTPYKEKSVIVTRAVVKDSQGSIIGAVGQVKFSHETKRLAQKLQQMDDELQYYKNELKRLVESKYSFNTIIGKSPQITELIKLSEKAAQNDFTVLILGSTGTGKEVFANAIHYASRRKHMPFIRVNCAAIPSELLESELFGYEEGSFTGAKKGGKKGKFELADGGTIFLDEIGDMPMNMQAKLLRVLQEQEIEKVGSSQSIPINVRIIAATNQNIEENIINNKFRADLYYRLNVIQLKLPLLKERSEDIPLFIQCFLDKMNEKYDTYIAISMEAKRALVQYSWPGNVRELKNIIERAYSQVDDKVILPSHLPANIIYKTKTRSFVGNNKSLDSIENEFEKELILAALKENNYNCKLTAEKLSIHRSTLYKKMDKLNIDRSSMVN